MLTVEVKDASKIADGLSEAEIYCDEVGIAELKKAIAFLDSGETHVHFMTESWAGAELTEEAQGEGNTLLHHLKITMRRSEPTTSANMGEAPRVHSDLE